MINGHVQSFRHACENGVCTYRKKLVPTLLERICAETRCWCLTREEWTKAEGGIYRGTAIHKDYNSYFSSRRRSDI